MLRRRGSLVLRSRPVTTTDPKEPALTSITSPAPAAPCRRTRGRGSDRSEQGITTAEYAVGTAAGAGLAGLLYKLLTGGFGDKLLKTLFDHVLGLLGIG